MMRTNRSARVGADECRLEPDDPEIFGVLLGAASSLLATAVLGATKVVYSRLKRHMSRPALDTPSLHEQPAPALPRLEDRVGRVRSLVDKLETLATRAREVVQPQTRFRLGTVVLLPRDRIEDYVRLRDELLEMVRHADDAARDLISELSGEMETAGKTGAEIKARIKFLEQHLRRAKTASLAEEQFLEIAAVLRGLRHAVDELDDMVRTGARQGVT